jgi:uncharacterized phage-associated protein
MPIQSHQMDREKLKEAVLLIASHCPPEEMGNVKMHKALYFADMLFYLAEGRPLTGVDYIKQKFGPVARHLTAAINELSAEGRLEVTETEYFGLFKKNYQPREPFKANRLSENEMAFLRETTDYVRGKSAKEISELSHNAAWEMADLGEVIPYFTALRLVPTEVTESDRQWALDSAREIATEPLTL